MRKKLKNILIQHSYLWLVLGSLFVLRLILVLVVGDNGWEPDSFQHMNEVGTVFLNFPENVAIGIGVWSKPIYTYLFGFLSLLPVPLLISAKVLNLLIISAISALLYAILRKLSINKWQALLLIVIYNLSFITFKSSLTTLTEPIFTLFLVAGFYLAIHKKYTFAGLVLGLSILARIEGLYFLGVYNLWLLWQQRELINSSYQDFIRAIGEVWVISIIPALLWNFLGFLQSGRIFYIFDKGYPVDSVAMYGTGGWSFFFKSMLTFELVISILVTTAIIYLAIKMVRDRHYLPYRTLAAIFFAGFFFSQVITWKYGLFGSAGLLRYFVAIMPFAIITISTIKFDWRVLLAAVSVSAISLLTHFFGLGPLESQWIDSNDIYRNAGEFIKENYPEAQFLGTARPAIVYYSDYSLEKANIFYDPADRTPEPGEYIIYAWTKSWEETILGVQQQDIEEVAEATEKFSSTLTEEEIVVFISGSY